MSGEAKDQELARALIAIIEARVSQGSDPQFLRSYAQEAREQGHAFGNAQWARVAGLVQAQRQDLAHMIKVRPSAPPPARRLTPRANLTITPAAARRGILGLWASAVQDSRDVNLVVRVANLLADAEQDGDTGYPAYLSDQIQQAQEYLSRLQNVVDHPAAAERARTDWRERDDMTAAPAR